MEIVHVDPLINIRQTNLWWFHTWYIFDYYLSIICTFSLWSYRKISIFPLISQNDQYLPFDLTEWSVSSLWSHRMISIFPLISPNDQYLPFDLTEWSVSSLWSYRMISIFPLILQNDISIFPLILQNDININELNIIDQYNIKHSIMLLIKTKTSVSTVIIISIEAQPVGLAAILMINSVSAFNNTIILYIYIYITCTYIDVFLCLTIHVKFSF